MSPTGESYSFRSCVRAGEAKLCVPARRCCFRGWAAEARKMLRGGVVACPVPFAPSVPFVPLPFGPNSPPNLLISRRLVL